MKGIPKDSNNLYEDKLSTKRLRRVFDTNVFGLMDVTTAALPYLRRSNDGRMVVVGSRSAWRAEIPISKILNSRLMYLRINSLNAYQIVGNRSGHVLLTIQPFLTKYLTQDITQAQRRLFMVCCFLL